MFHKQYQGEALLNFENKAILATKTRDLRGDPLVVSERLGAMASPCCALAHIRKATWGGGGNGVMRYLLPPLAGADYGCLSTMATWSSDQDESRQTEESREPERGLSLLAAAGACELWWAEGANCPPAPGARRSPSLAVGAAVSARSQLLHAAAWSGSHPAGHLFGMADARGAGRLDRRRTVPGSIGAAAHDICHCICVLGPVAALASVFVVLEPAVLIGLLPRRF